MRVQNRSTLKVELASIIFALFMILLLGNVRPNEQLSKTCFQDILISLYFDEICAHLLQNQFTYYGPGKFLRRKVPAWNFLTFELLFWADVRHLAIWFLLFDAQYFRYQLHQWIGWHDSWNGKHDDHCKLRALTGGYWLKLWRHMSELA